MKTLIHTLIIKAVLITGLTSGSNNCQAQHIIFGREMQVELGLNFGPTFFLGDLGGNRGKGTKFIKDVNLELTKMMKGGFISIYPQDWIGLRFAGQYTYVSGRDNIINTKGEDELWRKQRNLDFKSNMWEVYGAVEIFPTLIFHQGYDEKPTYQPYGFIGVGLFHFNPKGSITDQYGRVTWHELHPLRTEGQGMAEYPDRKPYKLTQINIPMGCGVRRQINNKISTSVELLYRKTFTDYIDDVSTNYIDPQYFNVYLSPEQASIARQIHDKTVGIITPGVNRYEPGTQRGNYRNMDAYFSVVLKFGLRLGVTDDQWGRSRKQMRCPHFY
jgi:hypothetical protein